VSHYEVLGVSADASAAEVRRAYLALARAHHPDFHVGDSAAVRGDAERTMQRLNEAWLVLGDRRRRADYDLTLPRPVDRGWAAGTAHPDFVPLDPDEDPVEEEPGTGRGVPRWQQLLPVSCLAAALVALAAAMVVGGRLLAGLGVVLLVGAGAGFVLTPMLTVLRTYERDPER
jgi:DnaJ domain